jgi:hypothetical protein
MPEDGHFASLGLSFPITKWSCVHIPQTVHLEGKDWLRFVGCCMPSTQHRVRYIVDSQLRLVSWRNGSTISQALCQVL